MGLVQCYGFNKAFSQQFYLLGKERFGNGCPDLLIILKSLNYDIHTSYTVQNYMRNYDQGKSPLCERLRERFVVVFYDTF